MPALAEHPFVMNPLFFQGSDEFFVPLPQEIILPNADPEQAEFCIGRRGIGEELLRGFRRQRRGAESADPGEAVGMAKANRQCLAAAHAQARDGPMRGVRLDPIERFHERQRVVEEFMLERLHGRAALGRVVESCRAERMAIKHHDDHRARFPLGDQIVENPVGFAVLHPRLLVVAGAVVLVLVVMHKQHAHTVIRESRWAAVLRHVVEGLHLMGNRRTLVRTALVSLLYLLLQYLTVYAMMRAYVLDYSFWVAAGVLTIVRLATVVPNAPGNIGLFNFACFMAMKLFELGDNDATTFSTILFGALTLPLLIGGAVATALTGSNIGELHDHARRGLDAHKAGPPAGTNS